MGKAQPLKEDLSQLLRRVDVEFPGISVDPLFQLPDSDPKLLPKLPQRSSVHLEACRLHLSQHPAQWQLDVEIQLPQAHLLQMRQHRFIQCIDGESMTEPKFLSLDWVIVVQRDRLGQLLMKIGDREPVNIITARCGVQQVASQGSIEDKSLRWKTIFYQEPGQILDVMGYLFDAPCK